MSKKTPNPFASIIAEHQKEAAPIAEQQEDAEPVQSPSVPVTKTEGKRAKRGNPDNSAVTVYINTEIYTRAQFEMARKGRKREMSELFTELLQEWLKNLDSSK